MEKKIAISLWSCPFEPFVSAICINGGREERYRRVSAKMKAHIVCVKTGGTANDFALCVLMKRAGCFLFLPHKK